MGVAAHRATRSTSFSFLSPEELVKAAEADYAAMDDRTDGTEATSSSIPAGANLRICCFTIQNVKSALLRREVLQELKVQSCRPDCPQPTASSADKFKKTPICVVQPQRWFVIPPLIVYILLCLQARRRWVPHLLLHSRRHPFPSWLFRALQPPLLLCKPYQCCRARPYRALQLPVLRCPRFRFRVFWLGHLWQSRRR